MSRQWKIISTLYGEAFEIGANAGVSERGYLIRQLPNWEEFFELDEKEKNFYREQALRYLEYYDSIVGRDVEESFEEFLKVYTEKIQADRREELSPEQIRVSLDDIDKRNIVGLVRLGYSVGRELLEWSDGEFLLQPKVEGLYPDFLIIKDGSVKAIGDFKTYGGFFEKDLTSVVWQLNFDLYNRNEVLLKIQPLKIWDYKKLFSVLMKYMKVIRYAMLLNIFPVKALVVFPQGYSILNIESIEKLGEWRNTILQIAEKAMPEEISEESKILLLEHLKTTKGYIAKEGDGFYLVDDAESKRVLLKFFKPSADKTYYGKVNVKFNFTDIEIIRKKHEEEFWGILRSNYDVLINASDQGIGKNTMLIKYFKELYSENQNFKVLFVAPRKRILLELEERLKGTPIKITKTFSDLRIGIEKDDTFYEVPRFDESFRSASSKITEALNSDVNVILATSQAFSYFIHSGASKIITKADIVVFDEFLNSGAPAIEAVLNFLRQFSKRRKDARLKRVIITDASLTCFELTKRAFEEHLGNDGEVYTPLMTYIVPRNEPIEEIVLKHFKAGNLKFIYYRRLLDFQLNFYALGFHFEDYFPNWDYLLKNLDYLLRTHGGISIFKYLDENKVIFYIDNKVYVESLAKYLERNGYKAVPIHSGTVDKSVDLNANIVGTSTLAFGSNLTNHELLIVLPPYKGHNYSDRAYNVELFRQVIKRMRGREDKIKHVVFVGFCNEKKDRGIAYRTARNFVREVLMNRRFHVLIPMHSGEYLFTLFSEIPKERTRIPMEKFLRDYMPRLKRLFYASGFSIYETFAIGFGNEKILYLPVPYVVYKLDKWRLAKQFSIEVIAEREDARDEFLKRIDEESFDEELLTLYQLIKRDEEKGVAEIRCFFKEKLEGLNSYQIADYFTKALTPKYITATYSSILLVSSMFPIYSRNWKDLRFLQSPLYKVFLGDSKYIEIPVIVREDSFATPGILIYHPAIETPAKRGGKPFEEKIKMILQKERLKEDTLFLPNLWRML